MIFIYSKSFKILLFTFITSRPKHVQQNNIVRRTGGCKCCENKYRKLTTILYTWSSHSYRMTTIVSRVNHRSCLSISVWSPYYNAPERNTGSYVPDSLREVRWFFNVPVKHFREEKGDGTYGLSFLPEKNRCQKRELTKRDSLKFRKRIPFPSSWSLSFLFSCKKYFGNYISIRN